MAVVDSGYLNACGSVCEPGKLLPVQPTVGCHGRAARGKCRMSVATAQIASSLWLKQLAALVVWRPCTRLALAGRQWHPAPGGTTTQSRGHLFWLRHPGSENRRHSRLITYEPFRLSDQRHFIRLNGYFVGAIAQQIHECIGRLLRSDVNYTYLDGTSIRCNRTLEHLRD